jgi:hypothetical protein
VGPGVHPISERGGEAGHQTVLSPLPLSDILHPRFHPPRRRPVAPSVDLSHLPRRDLLRARSGAVDFGFALMRTLLQVFAVAALLLLDATSADAADCMCDRLSAEGCSENAQIREVPTAPPLWCERTDDPRCMPASTHGTSVNTLVPVAMSWAQPIRWNAPPRTGIRLDARVDGDALSEHSRRVERPPR